jgi:hypothetical protein
MVVMMDRNRLVELPVGSAFYPETIKPDANGMIDGTCNGEMVMMFSRDLADHAEPIEEVEVGAGQPDR